MKRASISVVVPVYNSEKSLEELCHRIDSSLRVIGHDYEIILVDDGSMDNSWSVMKSVRLGNKKAKIIRLGRNFGQHNALMCGLHHASGDFIVTMDDDLQHPPEEISKLIEAIENSGNDVVYGAYIKKEHSFLKNLGSYIYRRITVAILKNGSDQNKSSFMIIRRGLLQYITCDKTPNPVLGMMISFVTKKSSSIPVEHCRRNYGRTTYSMKKLLKQFFHSITYYTNLPLRVASMLGLSSVIFSFILLCYYLIQYLRGAIGVPGWTTLVLLILFFSGIILFSLGIIGEYLIRILQETRRTPQYVIMEKEIDEY
jgi:dolichol-phosphate mannosyltransferase/undecaprenyl-phosphate 4-deoxy-4-formamido-L-arabinose transferase